MRKEVTHARDLPPRHLWRFGIESDATRLCAFYRFADLQDAGDDRVPRHAVLQKRGLSVTRIGADRRNRLKDVLQILPGPARHPATEPGEGLRARLQALQASGTGA